MYENREENNVLTFRDMSDLSYFGGGAERAKNKKEKRKVDFSSVLEGMDEKRAIAEDLIDDIIDVIFE